MNLFRKKPEKITAIHPDVKKLVSKVTTIEHEGRKIDFYGFNTLFDMSARRFTDMNNFLENKRRGIDNEELQKALAESIEGLEANDLKGVTNSLIIQKYLKARLEISEDIDLIMRVISCAFFTKDEDLSYYDWDIGTWKIELFEKTGLKSFFLTKSVSNFLKSIGSSPDNIKTSIEIRQKLKHSLRELNKMGILLDSTSSKKAD